VLLKKLKVEEVEVTNKDGKTGNRTYRLYGYTGSERFRLALGTDSMATAGERAKWIERAVEDGSESPKWLLLKDALPRRTFEFFAALVNYVDVPVVIKKEPTWTELRDSYVATLDFKILDEKMTESTKTNYLQSLRAFDEFMTLRGFSLKDVTEDVVIQDFKPWRKKSILSKSNSRQKANRLSFDLVILRSVFSHSYSKAWAKLGYAPIENPFPPMSKENKPGAKPEEKTLPFTGLELAKLRAAAGEKTSTDSEGRSYTLQHGTDLLAFELLLRTGLRRCDAATLLWSDIRWNMGKGGMIRVDARKNDEGIFMPIHSELLRVLRAEKTRRNPLESQTVLVNPQKGNAYDVDGKRLYARMKGLGKRLGIDDVRPHRFRCSFAVDALMKGETPLQIATWLGDALETVVKHYLPLSVAMSDNARNTLERRDAGIEAVEQLEEQSSVAVMRREKVA